VPSTGRTVHASRAFDLPGAVGLTGAMLLLVYTLVEAPRVGWSAPRTLVSLALVAATLAAFARHESRTRAPLVRLGILRSATLVRANVGALTLFGGWVGFQFIATLYMQQLRGWSPLETGLAIFPGGLLVALLSPRIAPLVARFGVARLVVAGMALIVTGYALFVPIGLHSAYATRVLPTMILAGCGFALAFGPLNIMATNCIAPSEQGLAGALLNTSFQLGGALVLAVVSAVNNAAAGAAGSPQGLLDGFHAALLVSVAAGGLGLVAVGAPRLTRRAAEPAAEHALDDAA
jgi:hypothetical protein